MLRRLAPETSANWVNLKTFENKRIGIDTSIYLHTFVKTSESNNAHIKGLYDMTRFLTSMNITPVFVFDNANFKRHVIKKLELDKRAVQKVEQNKKMARLEERNKRLESVVELIKSEVDEKDPKLKKDAKEKRKKIIKSTVETLKVVIKTSKSSDEKRDAEHEMELITKTPLEKTDQMVDLQKSTKAKSKVLKMRSRGLNTKMFNECKQLLTVMGIPYITSDSSYEAEAICAYLADYGITSATISEDSDTILFGDSLLLTKYGKDSNKSMIQIVDVVKIRDTLELSKQQFIDYCILLGTDFCSTLERLGQVKAFDAIKKYLSIEGILENKLELKLKGNISLDYENARRVFSRKYEVPKNWDDKGMWDIKIRNSEELKRFLKSFDIVPDDCKASASAIVKF